MPTNLSQTGAAERCSYVDAPNEAAVEVSAVEVSEDATDELEAVFEAQYEGVARAIAKVICDPGRSEELAVEVFLKWSRNPAAQGENSKGWLYRAAVRMAIDELRRQERRTRYERLLVWVRKPPTPEELHSAHEEQNKVLTVLSAIAPRQAELLLLRSQGLTYEELALALHLNPISVGRLLSRAQQAFRKEYLKKYGKE